MADENKPSVATEGTSPDAAATKPAAPVRVQVVYGAAPPARTPPLEIHERKAAPATISDRKPGQ